MYKDPYAGEYEHIVNGVANAGFEVPGSVLYALNMRMPQKPTHDATLIWNCTCPTCGNVVDKYEKWGETWVRIEPPYCAICGQAIDWAGVDNGKDQ